MTKFNATIIVLSMALTFSGASLHGQDGIRTASLSPIAPSMKGLPTVLEPVAPDTISGELSSELESLSLGEEVVGKEVIGEEVVGEEVVGEEVVGEDYFEKDVDGLVEQFSSAHRNRVFGINALSMSRANFNDSRLFDGGLSSGRITLEDTGGLELFMTTRNSHGQGWELRYFGLFGGSESISETIFPTGASASLTRDGDAHNVEVNYLRQAEGPLSGLGLSLDEVIFGIRYFQFNDGLNFNSNFSSSFRQRAENSLFGLQIGRRLEKQFGHGLGFVGVGKLGIYNNRLDSSFAINGGSTVTDSKDDVAFLGELDLGVTYTFRPNARLKLGYRAIAATELGIAERQSSVGVSPSQVTDSDGDIYLEGGYIGIEFVR